MKPKIAIPIGDCAGISAEIIVKAIASGQAGELADCVVCGGYHILEQTAEMLGASCVREGTKIALAGRTAALCEAFCPREFEYGKISAECGRASYECVKRAVGLAAAGEADAVVTTCINKESLRAAKVPFIGHTEMFAHLLGCGAESALTLFEVMGLRVFFLSRHLSLKDAIGYVQKDNIEGCLVRCFAALEKLGVKDASIAVAGLNPHLGEHGLFGDEEAREIVPAVETMKNKGYRVFGPIGADSVFWQARQGKFDAVLSLYHDQGHIATKTLDFEKCISITAGLPVLRTSVDHGTAFDIAGKGIASEKSLVEAISLAAKYAPFYR